MKLYVARHGETTWNRERKICGRTDVPLTERGLLQARELAERVSGLHIDAILASSSMPTVFRPVELDDRKYVDGGVLCRVPVRQVKEMGADVVVAVDVMGQLRPQEKIGSVVSLITRVYDIMDANNTEKYRKETADITDLWLEPDMGDANAYKLKYDPEIYEAGYRCGKENAETILRLLGD